MVVPIRGLELTASTQVNATAPGYGTAPPLDVSVVEPTFEFFDLENARVVGSGLDFFGLDFQVLSSEDVFQSPRFVSANIDVIVAVADEVWGRS